MASPAAAVALVALLLAFSGTGHPSLAPGARTLATPSPLPVTGVFPGNLSASIVPSEGTAGSVVTVTGTITNASGPHVYALLFFTGDGGVYSVDAQSQGSEQTATVDWAYPSAGHYTIEVQGEYFTGFASPPRNFSAPVSYRVTVVDASTIDSHFASSLEFTALVLGAVATLLLVGVLIAPRVGRKPPTVAPGPRRGPEED